MRFATAKVGISLAVLCLLALASTALAQNAGSSTGISGTVTDPTGAVIPGATVTVHNPVSGFERTATTDALGNFSSSNFLWKAPRRR